MNKPRILIIENSIAITGALKSIVRSSQGLQNKFTFVFLLPKNCMASNHVRELGFETFELPMTELRKNTISLIAYVPTLLYNGVKLFQNIRKFKIDLIVVNDFYNLIPAVYKFLGGHLSYLCYVRFLPSKFPNPLVKFWCAWHKRYAYTTIVVSEAVQKELPYNERVEVIGNELPSEEIQFTSGSNSTTILYPANYILGKGQQFGLESFALISKKHPLWKLKFIGGDMGLQKNKDFKKNLIELARKLEIDEQVEWHDFANNISEEYINACFVLNFSESESFSMTCLEAMFYGRPVIATRSGGPSEIIDQNETGILVDIKDVTAMAQAMDYLIVNSNKREIMAHRAYLSVREKFSYANTVEKLGKVYENALKTS